MIRIKRLKNEKIILLEYSSESGRWLPEKLKNEGSAVLTKTYHLNLSHVFL